MIKTAGSVTAAKGFYAASCAAGIKYKNRTDMAMIYSDEPCEVAGTFTTNMVKAAPVLWDREVVYSGKKVQAVIVNSGIANAATGKEGLDICRQTADIAGAELGIDPDAVLIGSTGVIGMQIPIDRIKDGVVQLAKKKAATLEAGTEASKAIMTTDTVNKETAYQIELPAADGDGSVTVTIGGMSKGSGMIHPNMCTMLGYITTDAAIDKSLLQKATSEIVKDTFNMISVDGDTSTNDTLLVMANGKAGNACIAEEGAAYNTFFAALKQICEDLAIKMASDGEGATKLVTSKVLHMDTKENARILARSVIHSSLVKAMIFGKDANCGRVLCALGYAGPEFDPNTVTVTLKGEEKDVIFCENGVVLPFDEELALELLSKDAVTLVSDMHMGEEEATAWGCDLTYDYVKINGDYRT